MNKTELMRYNFPQNAVLFADAAAIIVVTIDLMDFGVLSPACVLDCFVQYDVVIDSTEPREFQLYAGRVHAEPNILYEKRFRVSFEEKNGTFLVFTTFELANLIWHLNDNE